MEAGAGERLGPHSPWSVLADLGGMRAPEAHDTDRIAENVHRRIVSLDGQLQDDQI
jgi:hypothetical protein